MSLLWSENEMTHRIMNNNECVKTRKETATHEMGKWVKCEINRDSRHLEIKMAKTQWGWKVLQRAVRKIFRYDESKLPGELATWRFWRAMLRHYQLLGARSETAGSLSLITFTSLLFWHPMHDTIMLLFNRIWNRPSSLADLLP